MVFYAGHLELHSLHLKNVSRGIPVKLRKARYNIVNGMTIYLMKKLLLHFILLPINVLGIQRLEQSGCNTIAIKKVDLTWDIKA